MLLHANVNAMRWVLLQRFSGTNLLQLQWIYASI
jgi:hypothetical protein